MFDLRYMYAATVTGVGAGFVNADGKTLRTIGNLPVKVGDTVYTDGRIAYGHVPVRSSVNITHSQLALIFSGRWYSIFHENGHRYSDNQRIAFDRRTNISNAFNWLFERDNKLYGYIYGDASDGIGDYLDLYVTDHAVFTAEYAVNDAAFEDVAPTPYSEWTSQNINCLISNYYYHVTNNNSFELRKDGGIRVVSNPVIEIKKNGKLLKSLTLSDYQFVINKLKELYLSYDSIDPKLKRYDSEGEVDHADEHGEYEGHIYNVDIWITFLYTQVLNFHFTDNNGNWEMIILSMTSGTCSPHTTDRGGKEDDYEEVNSFFSFYCPVIYYVLRVKSSGETSVLHECVVVQKFPNNGVTRRNWINARSVEVTEVATLKRPSFEINFGDYSLTTDLSKVDSVKDSEGNTIATSLPLPGFQIFTMPDYTQPPPSYHEYVPTNFLSTNLETGNTTILSDWDVFRMGNILGYSSGYAYSSRKEVSTNVMILAQNASSYIGRVSAYQLKNRQYMVCIRKQGAFDKIGNKWYSFNQAPANINIDPIKNIRIVKEIKSINDLIADVTKPKNS